MSERAMPEEGYKCIIVPAENGRGSYIIERLIGQRISIKVGKISIYGNFSEAAEIAEAINELVGIKTTVKL
jgi:rRNA processing protein Krr1/Pno1